MLQILPTARIILCGSPAEGSLAQDILALVPAARERVLIAIDELPIGRLLARQERAPSLIWVNTGPAHSAAAMGCPEVVRFARHAHRAGDLYAPQPTTTPRQIVLPTEPSAEAGLDSVTPDAVVNAWQELAGIQTKPPSPYPCNWVDVGVPTDACRRCGNRRPPLSGLAVGASLLAIQRGRCREQARSHNLDCIDAPY